MESGTQVELSCFHCGDKCQDERISFDSHVFCCEGCRLVYEILTENNLKTYYKFNSSPGIKTVNEDSSGRFDFLDDPSVRSGLLNFTDGQTAIVSLYIPQMHCSSCIWLLENLNTLIPAVIRSRVDFIRRTATITFQESKISLKELVQVLSKIGYEPHLDMADLEGKSVKNAAKATTFRIGIAGFVFGNIMLFSFPEYFSLSGYSDPGFNKVFSYLNLSLSIPVLVYCSAPFFRSAAKSLRQKFLNIDVPIALGIAVMFIRSFIEIVSDSGPGYLDTMAGLVFFMLVGRAFQDKTYKTISFERDYKSFFPIAVMSKQQGKGDERSLPVSKLEIDDHIIIRNKELIPADGILLKGRARIDFSFVTGESALHEKKAGDLIYAGGRQIGEAIELRITKKVSQSYLTELWNQDSLKNPQEQASFQTLVNRISHYFTVAIILIATAGWAYWFFRGDLPKAWNAFTAVLIIACPCALAISSPFTLGNIIRVFGRRKFYLKNVNVIEKLADINTIVFDKTGTLTHRESASVSFEGKELSVQEESVIATLAHHSSHPLSRMLYSALENKSEAVVNNFREVTGSGLEGEVSGIRIRIGSGKFTGENEGDGQANTSRIYVTFDGQLRGYFKIGNTYRPGLEQLIASLKTKGFALEVLSGDNEGEKEQLKRIFGNGVVFRFNQSPMNKLNAIKNLQEEGRKVLMVGDGLNDAGALKQSDAGISVSDDINNFSPASDAILSADNLSRLDRFLALCRISHKVILASFAISLIYNLAGLYYALQGTLSPVIAAILMPLSSVTIIVFTTGITNLIAGRKVYR
jgi:Cu+-exporting ATPase